VTQIVARALEAFTPGQVTMFGSDLEPSAKHALALSLALHELATNATKYGALSRPEGRVSVQWTVEDEALLLDWEESGGPPVVPPTHKGFGSRLLEEVVVHDLGGKIELEYDASGVRCRITAKR
jgi:chemotaxis family two-component system sensor kinase Cph1